MDGGGEVGREGGMDEIDKIKHHRLLEGKRCYVHVRTLNEFHELLDVTWLNKVLNDLLMDFPA